MGYIVSVQGRKKEIPYTFKKKSGAESFVNHLPKGTKYATGTYRRK